MSSVSWFKDEDWSLVEVSGDDRVDFLKRLTTNILPQSASPLIHNFFLSVNARIQAEFWVSAQPEKLCLLTPRSQIEALKECIDRYHFGEDLTVSQIPGQLFVVANVPPETLQEEADLVFSPDPRYGQDCHWCFVTQERNQAFQVYLDQLGARMSEEDRECRRVASGTPRHGIDYDQDTLFVEMAQQGDFSETKGCYPGQEIVARVLHRGRLNKHLRGFRSEQIIPSDWTMEVDGKRVASVRTVAKTPSGGSTGYLLVRREYGAVGKELTGTDEAGVEYTLSVTPRTGEVLTGVEE